ncbi:aldo/keto reductase [Saliterribacillus persicus]|uniref:Aryl-alcohol dehydrogenase-like predicted oxidoreductase n=1 Tax=Saliterribacillus persicus TaxID=930114 RepID=A0A368XTF7_9BACI|nr:aldo/keto reductase [Saliterribacillus persicus]RCW69797.1 aryl-alcohol dehydrogenase-like predicted oxidoreductase [Saliterribacillus persicus]
MQDRYLGRTGLRVSELCLGTMTLGRETSEADSGKILDRYKAEGGNFLDTADVYTRGASEEIVGSWLQKQNRDDFVLATKVRFPMGEGPNDVGLSRKHIISGVKESLRRLKTDYIDLYQVHAWDPRTPLEETLSTLNDLVREGLVRYIGASNYKGWQLQKAIDMSEKNGWEKFVCLQPQYNLLTRATEWELIDVCENEGLGVIPWSPLRGGWLSGKFTRELSKPPENTRIAEADKKGYSETWDMYNNETTWNLIDTLIEVAKEVNKTPAQTAINWLLNKRGVTAPIIGARNREQLEANLGSAGWSLNDNQMARLDRASDLFVSYPYDQAAHDQRTRGRE